MANLSETRMIEYQGDYVTDLCELTDYPSVDVGAVNRLFKEWLLNKNQDIMTFRDHVHKSAVTGTVGRVPQKPWLSLFDDSLEAFVTDFP